MKTKQFSFTYPLEVWREDGTLVVIEVNVSGEFQKGGTPEIL